MKTVILAGGFGTRISEESHLIPKPMVEIGGMPILWHIMKIYSSYGYNDFVICCGYKQHVIKEYFADYFLYRSDITFDFTDNGKMIVHSNENEPWKVTLVDTGLNTMTGGRVKRIQKYIGDEVSKEFTVPVVYIDRRPGVEFNFVSSDNETGGFLATEELIKKGCRKIVLIHDVNSYSTVNKRKQGYLRAQKQYGIEIDDSRMVPCRVSYPDARNTVKKLVADGVDFDGVFCTTDSMALGALRGLKECGKRVPEDVKLVGFDGITHTEISDPPITTVIQDTDQLGKRSVEVLMDLINNNTGKIHEYTIPVKLSVRGSTD